MHPWERSLAWFHITKASLGGNTIQKSPLITTYDICKMGCFIWEHHESHYSQQICTLRSDFFLLSAAEQIALSLVITSYFFLHTSQMVKCQITSFWQPTQAFINLFIPSVSGMQHSLLALYLLPCSGPQPPYSCSTPCSHSAIVISMAYRRSLWTVSCLNINDWKWQWGHCWLDKKSCWSGKYSWCFMW